MEETHARLVEDTLEEMLYNQRKVVTALTLARYADVKSKEAMSVMADFYARADKEQRRKSGLYGVYLLSGERSDRDALHRNASILVREADLEATRASFSRVDECTLFSLQCFELEDLCHIFRTDEEDNLAFLSSDHERIGIVFTDPLAVLHTDEELMREARKKMPNSFDVMKAYAAGKGADVYAYKRAQEEKQKKKEEAEHNRLEALFQKACERQKTPKGSPVKVRASPFSAEKEKEKEEEGEKKDEERKEEEKKDEEASNSPILNRKRQRKIMLDGDSEGEGETSAASPKERAAKKRKEEEEKMEKAKERVKRGEERKKKRATIESDDELFDANDDSPVKKDIKQEEMDEDEVEEKRGRKKGKKEEKREKTRTLEEAGALRRSPRKNLAAPSSYSGPTKKFVQQDVSFMDKNGMMGTRREMVEVEISEEELKREKEREEARRPLEAAKKTNLPPAQKTGPKGAAASKKAAAGQSKISSFFTKK